jgi:hypothetical protein
LKESGLSLVLKTKISQQMLALPASKKNESYTNGILIQQDLYNSKVGGPNEALMFLGLLQQQKIFSPKQAGVG